MKKKAASPKLIYASLAIVVLAGILIFAGKPMPSKTEPEKIDNRTKVEQALNTFIPANSDVKSFKIVQLWIKDGFAKAMIRPIDVETDNATLILKEINGNWEVVWGPGTDGFQNVEGLPPSFIAN